MRQNSDLWRINGIIDKTTVHTFSLEDKIKTLEHIRCISPQIIYHIAAAGTAVGRIPYTMDELMISNTLSSMHLMDAAMEISCEYFMNTGSSSEYGIKDKPMIEGDSIEPNNLYAISKAATSSYASFLRKNKNSPIVTYRLFSVY